jgi:hypothetical protein
MIEDGVGMQGRLLIFIPGVSLATVVVSAGLRGKLLRLQADALSCRGEYTGRALD